MNDFIQNAFGQHKRMPTHENNFRMHIRVYSKWKHSAASTCLVLIFLPHLLSLNDLGPVLHSVGLRCELLGHVAIVNVVVGKVLHVVTQSSAVTWAHTNTQSASCFSSVSGPAHTPSVTFSELGEVRGDRRGGAGRQAKDTERL